ncbi:hypothetical protein O5D80_001196 [Batrachochytrium dendrobatidis]|nr:hypothetical protein O5D80_001196 [Batrachochytrium dendrobatidis]
MDSNFPDYVSPPAGGYIKGSTSLSGETGFSTRQIESAWGATFVFYILYLIFIQLESYYQHQLYHSFYPPLLSRSLESTPEPTNAATTTTATTALPVNIQNAAVIETSIDPPLSRFYKRMHMRLLNVGSAVCDSFLILLGTTLVSQAGYGITDGTTVFIWILLGLLTVWSIAQTFSAITRQLVDGIVFLLAFVALMVIWGFAWRGISTGEPI